MPEIKYWRPCDFEPATPDAPVRYARAPYAWPICCFTRRIPVYDQFGDELPDLFDDGGGIQVVVDIPEYAGMTDLSGNDLTVPADFAAYTVMCLRLLYATPVGKRVLDTLMDRSVVTIEYNAAQNACRGGARLNSVAQELINDHDLVTGQAVGRLEATKHAMRRKWPGSDARGCCRQLAREINAVCRSQHFALDAVHGMAGFDPGLATDDVVDLVDNGRPIRNLDQDQRKQVIMATAAILDGTSSRRASTSQASVSFCTRRNMTLNQERPPAIGLFHELVHAYYYAQGSQPGRDFGHYSTTLYEFKCVGLGPWRYHSPCENELRSQWSHVIGTFGNQIDHLNNKLVQRRTSYV